MNPVLSSLSANSPPNRFRTTLPTLRFFVASLLRRTSYESIARKIRSVCSHRNCAQRAAYAGALSAGRRRSAGGSLRLAGLRRSVLLVLRSSDVGYIRLDAPAEGHDELIDRAVAAGGAHSIKFTEACL